MQTNHQSAHHNPTNQLLLLQISEAQVRLNSADFAKLLLGILSRNRRRNNNIVTREPVNRASNAVLVGSLEGINDTENLSSVTTSRSGVGHDQTDLLAGVDDEDGADGQSQSLGVHVGGVLVVNHVVGVGNLALRVGNDGELELGASNLVDVLDPGVVRVDTVGTETNHLDTTGRELGLELGESTELGGTDGSEVIRVGEEDSPVVANVVVEGDLTVGGLGLEVGGSRAETEAMSG